MELVWVLVGGCGVWLFMRSRSARKQRHRATVGGDDAAHIAAAAQAVIGPQLMLAGRNEAALLGDRYCAGYLMGVLDAVAQRRGLDEGQDLMHIGAAFAVLFPGHPDAFARMLNLADDPQFSAGQLRGGTELVSLLSSDTRSTPLGLVDYWRGVSA